MTDELQVIYRKTPTKKKKEKKKEKGVRERERRLHITTYKLHFTDIQKKCISHPQLTISKLQQEKIT